jgi:hypothetical protein
VNTVRRTSWYIIIINSCGEDIFIFLLIFFHKY